MSVRKKLSNRDFRERERSRRKAAMAKFRGVLLDGRKAERFAIHEPPYCRCSCCRDVVSSGFRYKESPKGPLTLCHGCNSFLTRNPERSVRLIYNNPESNRRKF